MYNLSNKVALITGAAKGLGKAIAERYAALGANIIVHYSRDKLLADEVVNNIKAMGAKVISVQAHVNKITEIERLFAEAKKAFGKIDIVVANAENEVTEFTEDHFGREFGANLTGVYLTMRQAARNVTNNGRIIYIASTMISFSGTGMTVYCGSKSASSCLVDILSKEIGHKGITVNAIIPFAIDHAGIFIEADSYPKLRKQLLDSCPMGRLAEMGDVANAAEFFASDLSSFVNGQHLHVNGGATN